LERATFSLAVAVATTLFGANSGAPLATVGGCARRSPGDAFNLQSSAIAPGMGSHGHRRFAPEAAGPAYLNDGLGTSSHPADLNSKNLAPNISTFIPRAARR
jgi:hypothetical protein